MAARIGHHLLSELPFGRPPGKYLPLSIWLHLDTVMFGAGAAPNLPSGVRNCTPFNKFSGLALQPSGRGRAGVWRGRPVTGSSARDWTTSEGGAQGRAGRARRVGRAGSASG